MRLTRGEGPLGTGVFLLRPRQLDGGALEAEAWVLFAFLPLVPRGRVRLARRHQEQAEIYDEQRVSTLGAREALRVYAAGALALAFVVACGAGALQAAALSSWLGGIGVVLAGALPLALLGWLDQTLLRRRGA